MWVPCHHGMARPKVADGREGLQIWRVAANTLNRQSRTADKGWPSSLGVERGLTTPHRKKVRRYEMKGLGIGRVLKYAKLNRSNFYECTGAPLYSRGTRNDVLEYHEL
jgi:hypothetical protein